MYRAQPARVERPVLSARRTELGNEAPMIITPRRVARLLRRLAGIVRGGASQRRTR